MKDGAKEPLQKGLAAAQQEDWKPAIRYFLEAEKADPDAPQIWFNLGLASSKLPGYELRAMAWFQAYLLAVPDAPNADAIRSQITTLEVAFESRMGKVIETLEVVPPVRLAQGEHIFQSDKGPGSDARGLFLAGDAKTIGVRLAASRIFIGDTPGGLKTLRTTIGVDWNETKTEDPHSPDAWECSAVGGENPRTHLRNVVPDAHLMIGALVAAGNRDANYSVPCLHPSRFAYLLENSDLGLAEDFINRKEFGSYRQVTEFGWISCAVFDFKGAQRLHERLISRAKSLEAKWSTEDSRKVDSYSGDYRSGLAELFVAIREYDLARELAATIGHDAKTSSYARDTAAGVLVAAGKNELADALNKDAANDFRSGRRKLRDPCLDTYWWWGRTRKAFLVNLALKGVMFHSLKPDPDVRLTGTPVDAGDETELAAFLKASQNILAGPDAFASVHLAGQISEDLMKLAEAYRQVHGPYRR